MCVPERLSAVGGLYCGLTASFALWQTIPSHSHKKFALVGVYLDASVSENENRLRDFLKGSQAACFLLCHDLGLTCFDADVRNDLG